jgi:iron complex outermembrane recepter protein
MRRSNVHWGSVSALAVVAIMTAAPAAVQARTRPFSVVAQSAPSGIVLFAQQANIQILVSSTDTRGVRIGQVIGNFTIEEALRRLIAPAHLRLVSFDGRTAVLAKEAALVAPQPAAWAHARSRCVATSLRSRRTMRQPI